MIATKVFFPANKWEGSTRPNKQGLSRKAIMANIDASLSRLGSDYIDLHHTHRWDYHTLIEETMEALHDVVKAGKARYIGASSMYAWQFAKAQQVASSHGWSRFVWVQNYLNLIYREEEREMIPLCLDQSVGLMPWSPMARCRLTRPHGHQTARTHTDISGQSFYANNEVDDGRVIDVVEQITLERGVTMA